MKKPRTHRPLAAILADIADSKPFLPGSVHKGGVQRHRNKAGEMVEYHALPRLVCYANGRRLDRRFPDCLWQTMKTLTDNYRAFKALVAEFEEASLLENLPEGSKKN